PYLSPVESPTVSHAKLLRSHYGENIKVVGINSCVAEKMNYYDEPRQINATVTFQELKHWLDDLHIDYKSPKVNEGEELHFDPFDAENNHNYIFASGSIMQSINEANLDLSFISFSGMENAVNTLDLIDVKNIEKQTFVKLLACKDGCFSSSGSIKRGDNILKLLTFKDHYIGLTHADYPMMPPVDISRKYEAEKVENLHDIDSAKVNKVLDSMYISPFGKRINCGKCGYPTCREFAKGVVRGMTQKVNCVPHYQSILRDNFSIMIKNLPYSTFVIDNNLNIQESNTLFQETIGIPKSDKGDLPVKDVLYFMPFVEDIKQMIAEKSEFMEKDITVRGKMLRVTMFSLKNHKYICGIVRNLLAGDALGDELITRTRKVINDNIDSVQQIAYLLGENASRTEALLSSMLEMHKTEK
ncbi:MAG: [Fe-Fe] hydrogenase large subunit C-terminal domain-containing protein, partial [Rikenellaceae bacterium]